MFKANQLIRFFRYLEAQKSKVRKSSFGEFFNPVADELEARRLMTLNVWIDQDNALNIAADDNVGQSLKFEYTPAAGAAFAKYTITSFVATENFSFVTNNPSGLTLAKTNSSLGSYAKLTITESATGTLGSISVSTGSAADDFQNVMPGSAAVGSSNLASLYVSSGDGSDTMSVAAGLSSNFITFDGGAGEDLLVFSTTLTTATDVIQNVQSGFNPGLVFFTTFMTDGVFNGQSSINLGNIENINNQVDAANANIDYYLNGNFGVPQGSLATTSLRSVDSYFVTAKSASSTIIGYNTNDVFQVTTPAPAGGPGVQVNGTGLPVSRFYGLTQSTGVLTLLGLDGNDSFSVQSGASQTAKISIQGGSGSDLLLVGNDSGAATFIGDSSDTVRLTGRQDVDTVTLNDGSSGDLALAMNGATQTLFGGPRIEINTLAGSDNITLASAQNLNITVNAGDDGDTINASGLTGTASNTEIYGGTGNDNITGPAAGGIVIYGGIGNDTIIAQAASQIFGDEGNDNITGSSGKDRIYGGA
ncbi:MAG: hypothetical protein ACKO85_01895, partial [Isosphaeraceae bacterium]